MYRLFIANKNYSSWSLRPWLLMRQRAIPFEETLVPFGDATFGWFSPTGRVPCLHDGGRVVWDSLAVVEYLAERHEGVWPADADARAWARCAAAEMHSGFQTLRNACPMNCGVRVRMHEVGPGLASDCARLDALWQEGLGRFGGPFLGGADFSAVDAFFAPVAFRHQSYRLPLGAAAETYLGRLLSLSPMRDWYEAALREPFRDQSHEDEIRAAGEVDEDLRSRPA